MNNTKTISNVLLTIIAGILGAIAFNAVEANKEQKLAMQNLNIIVDKSYSHVMAVNLTNEGRRIAAATHFANQTLSIEERFDDKKLLNYGIAGIEAYLALHGDRDIVRGAQSFAALSKAFSFQVTTEFGKALAGKTYNPSSNTEVANEGAKND
jgi:hypothetical protein